MTYTYDVAVSGLWDTVTDMHTTLHALQTIDNVLTSWPNNLTCDHSIRP